ncbi:FAST kinase domain-containing protein 1, mitochondrial isoform X9 [Symphalangus syndactylus]|uniref:FAST kinase domain-containing protein 1, mitochondrial isoform X9 n=1 Tax=Symphalangus syndactylus TaxID=9590 RepID=UPI0024413FFC|nr:FAST kinase domain-containing protein 1, mitochondrial isoform X6 [Symphalangus syndactylus]
MKKTPVFLHLLVTNMLRLRAICPSSWRVFQFRPISCEPLIIQMNKCTDEEQIFDFIERNKAILSEKQVGCAFDMLWKLQKQKTGLLKNVEYVRDHPQFLTLHNLATNKFKLMNDDTLVNVLYVTQQFAGEAHDPLVEALVTEAWRRLERFDIKLLSEFSSCLADQHLYFSPLMGKIADIVHRNLETTQDLSSLSVLMVNISSLISRQFQQQLVNKTELLFDTIDSSEVNVAKRIAEFLRNVRYHYQPLLERCNNVFLSNVDHLDLDSISKILSVYKFLQFNSFEFIIMAKKKLTEMIPLCNHPASFVKLFVALGPIAGPEEKKQLKSTMLLMSEDLTGEQALAVLGAMGDMESRNSCLIERVTSVLHKHLDSYKPLELLKITQALTFLHFQRKEFFVKLRELLLSYLKNSFIPTEVSVLVRAISLLPSPHLDEVGISRIEAVLPQCDLNNLSSFATSVLRWIRHDHMYLDNITAKQLKLLQKLDHYGRQRLQHSNGLDLLWKELKSLKGNMFPESLLEEMIATLQHFMDDINYMNVVEIASFISSTDYLSTLLLDRIASVAVQQIEKIHPFTIPAIIRPFSMLNYDPPQRDEFLGTCVQHLNSYLGIGGMDGAQQQIYKMLAEVLGGINCVKASVLTPYYHTVDFECILDKRKKPLPYGSHNIALGQLPEMPWESNMEIVGSRLPPGAERIALEFLDAKALCRNIPHMKGKSAMKKRHLEILGYRVIQISQFEWNSMALSTKDARMDYLRERIFGEVKSCQQSSTFLASGTIFAEDNSSTDSSWGMV